MADNSMRGFRDPSRLGVTSLIRTLMVVVVVAEGCMCEKSQLPVSKPTHLNVD